MPVFLPSGAFWPRDEKSISCVIWAALTGRKRLVCPDYAPTPGPLNPLTSRPPGFFAIWHEQLCENIFTQFFASKKGYLSLLFISKHYLLEKKEL